jgi:hypothetical protein
MMSQSPIRFRSPRKLRDHMEPVVALNHRINAEVEQTATIPSLILKE